VLRLRTGSEPAECESTRSGTVLAEATLPSDWSSAVAGVLSGVGTWAATVVATGTVGHYEIADSTGAVVHEQGTVTGTAPGTGDIVLDQLTASVVIGQTVTISGYAATWS
jgi:hypothetical protein